MCYKLPSQEHDPSNLSGCVAMQLTRLYGWLLRLVLVGDQLGGSFSDETHPFSHIAGKVGD